LAPRDPVAAIAASGVGDVETVPEVDDVDERG